MGVDDVRLPNLDQTAKTRDRPEIPIANKPKWFHTRSEAAQRHRPVVVPLQVCNQDIQPATELPFDKLEQMILGTAPVDLRDHMQDAHLSPRSHIPTNPSR